MEEIKSIQEKYKEKSSKKTFDDKCDGLAGSQSPKRIGITSDRDATLYDREYNI